LHQLNKKMMFKKISLTLLLIAATTVASYATTGNEEKKMSVLQGRVTDAGTSEGLAGVVVEVEGTNIKVFTDFEGNFQLPALPEGSYNIKSSLVSYGELKLRNVKVNTENQGMVELRLHSN